MNRVKEVYRIFMTFIRGFVQALSASKAERELKNQQAKLGQALTLIADIRDNTRLQVSAKALLTDNLTLLSKIRELNSQPWHTTEEISVLPTGFQQKFDQYESQIGALKHAYARQCQENETLVLGRVNELSHGLIRKVAETLQLVSAPMVDYRDIYNHPEETLEARAQRVQDKWNEIYNLKLELYKVSESFKNSARI